MITVNSYTLLDQLPYVCIKIEDGMAYLKKVGDEQRGRFRKMDVELVPYFDEEKNFIVPKPKAPSRRKMTRFHYMKVIKDSVDMPLSHDLAYYVAEHLEYIVMMLADRAETNAEAHGDSRITAAHWYWLDIQPQEGFGKWSDNREMAKDYKKYLRGE